MVARAQAWLAIPLVVASIASCAGGGGSEPPRRAVRSLAALGHDGPTPPPHCALGAERRPGPGCLAPALVRSFAKGTKRDALLPIPPRLAGQRLVVSIDVDGEGRLDGPVTVATTLLPAAAEHEPLDVRRLAPAAPTDKGLRVWARPVAPERHATPPIAIGPGAMLAFGIGIDPQYVGSGVAAVTFTVTGTPAYGRERQLFQATLAVDDPASHAWQDRRVSLDDVAGERTVLAFTTRAVPRSDVAGVDRIDHAVVDALGLTALPLWGSPAILEPAREDDPPNVLLISLDTLRADVLGVYGGALPTSPRLDALAAEGVLFERATAVYPSTTASHMSMLTGLYPARHGVRSPLHPLAPDVPTLAAILSGHGWRTAAVTEDAMVAVSVGFPRGFGSYRENRAIYGPDTMRAAEVTVGAALDWLERHADQRFFLFVHTYAVHMPYTPPPEFDRFLTWHDGERTRPIAEAPPITRSWHAYAGEVRYADAQVGRLLDALARLGIADRTVVVVTADHGDEFGEHGGVSHNTTVYQEVLHVPMLLRAPGLLPAGRRVGTPVSLVDVAPTVLELVGVPAPVGWDGESQVARMRGAPDDLDRLVFAEVLKPGADGRLVAVRTASAKWIYSVGKDRVVEAYDLAADPTEQRRLDDPRVLERGRLAVTPYRLWLDGVQPATGEAVVDEGTQRNLRALGYVD